VTQQEHLTTGQLSAFLDKQLSPQEQAFFDAHLQSCQHCQFELAELRRTVVLLHAMPQPQLPRSFTLPTTVQPAQIRAALPHTAPARQRHVLRSTVRAVSSIAAVIGLIFILSGLLANVHLGVGGGAVTTSSSPVFNSSNGNTTGSSQVPQANVNTPGAIETPLIHNPQTSTPTASKLSPTPKATPTARATVKNGGAVEPPVLPPALDLGQPAGRLSLGALLLLLSIIGLVLTRRRYRRFQ